MAKSRYIPSIEYANNPHRSNPIRCIEQIQYEVIDAGKNSILELVPISRVPFTLYHGAIYIYRGNPYIVTHVDEKALKALLRPVQVDYVTIPKSFAIYDIQRVEKTSISPHISLPIHAGPILYTNTVNGYHKMNPKTKYIFDTIETSFKASSSKSVFGLWIDMVVDDSIDVEQYTNGIHAVQHLILKLAPIYGFLNSDLSAHCCGYKTILNKILIYDNSNRKNVILTLLDYLPTILLRAKDKLDICDCEQGCFKCIVFQNCPSNNKSISKSDAKYILNLLK
jgi:DEAD/DEAH box helicase domain-containing protein